MKERDMKEEFLKSFLADCESRGYRSQTVRDFGLRVPHLFSFLEHSGLSLHDLGVSEASGFQGFLLARKNAKGFRLSGRTVHAYLSAASSFYDYLKRRGVVLSNPFADMRKVRLEKTVPRNIPKVKDMDVLLSALSSFERKPLKTMISRYRLHVICELLYATGLRISEAAALVPADIDLEQRIVQVRDGKGGATRIAFLNEFSAGVLQVFLSGLREKTFSRWHDRRLLFGLGHERLGKFVNESLQNLCSELDLHPVTCHAFRHALGFHLLKSVTLQQ